MKIEISENGWLFLERAGRMQKQMCPRTDDGGRHYCGDHCPLFGEPDYDRASGIHRGYDMLAICEGRTLYGEITDKRQAPGTPPVPPGG